MTRTNTQAAYIGPFVLETASIDAHAKCRSPYHDDGKGVKGGGLLTGCPGYKSQNKIDLQHTGDERCGALPSLAAANPP